MSDAGSTLLAVIVGGALTASGSILADWLRSKREQRYSERERLRENMYDLQDGINALFDAYQVSVEAKNGHGAPWTQEHNAELNRAVRRIVMQSSRVSDSQTDHHLVQVLLNLRASHEAEDPEVAHAIFEKTGTTLMPPLGARIEELLHTHTRVSRDVGAWRAMREVDSQGKGEPPAADTSR